MKTFSIELTQDESRTVSMSLTFLADWLIANTQKGRNQELIDKLQNVHKKFRIAILPKPFYLDVVQESTDIASPDEITRPGV